MNEKELADLIRELVVREIAEGTPPPHPEPRTTNPEPRTLLRPSGNEGQATSPAPGQGEELALAKRVALWLGAPLPPMPWAGSWRPSGDRSFYLGRTPARLGVGHAGARYRTETILSFLADHSAARDAVQSNLDPEMLKSLGFLHVESAAESKALFLARPDLGRRLCDDSASVVTQKGMRSPQVQIAVGDGLSSTAINVNLPLLLPVLEAELKRSGARLGTRFAISNCRVACGDHVAKLLDAEVLCMLVGERPGLKTAESMGAYVTYFKVKDFNESKRSVISNIHKGGLPPDGEGALQVARLCLRALKLKKTGVDVT